MYRHHCWRRCHYQCRVGNSNAKFEVVSNDPVKKCQEGFSTYVENEKRTNKFEQDIQFGVDQNELDFFNEIFGVEKSKWATVRKEFDHILEGEKAGANCGAEIEKLLTSSTSEQIKIWVDGDCLLDGVGTSHADKALIVIKDGVLGSRMAIDGFNASIFMFNYDKSDFTASWLEKWNDSYICANTFSALCAEYIHQDRLGTDVTNWKRLPFLIHTSFILNGFFIVDVTPSTSRVFAGFKPSYDDTYANTNPNSGKPKILKGSFHDF
ncbi:hypothetical protein CS022_07690 [Veronia nyctiphanis]|uniref:Uncharacterized protein n=1 Tax=Veronia nyctiphanis TaxID=1278244 RepID=A0A4Q0YRV9_9GAMM|nr:hypothetical protein [Veronia nyctiphanis]RXJ73856.1 hypothetical protein CS022_07690 [Veronia nyctiphanis]